MDDNIEKWLDLGLRAIQRSREIANTYDSYFTTLSKIYDAVQKDFLGHITPVDIERLYRRRGYRDYFEANIYGLDSSMAGFHRIGGFLVVPVSASMIYLKARIYRDSWTAEIVDKNYSIRTDIPNSIHDGLSPGVAARKAELAMLRMEVVILEDILEEISRNKLKNAYVFIDGPIVDPPDVIIGDPSEFKKYMDDRAGAVRKLLLGDSEVVGFVKRIMGQMFYNRIVEEIGGDISIPRDEFKNDWTMTSILLMLHSINKCRGLDHCITYTKPLPLESRNIGSFEEQGVHVFYSYVLIKTPSILGPYRVDFVALDEEWDEERLYDKLSMIAQTISKLTLPGNKYPLPVILAHTMCTLPRREARRLLDYISSRFVLEIMRKRGADMLFKIIYPILKSEEEI